MVNHPFEENLHAILSQVLEALENNTKILLMNYLQDLAKPQLIE